LIENNQVVTRIRRVLACTVLLLYNNYYSCHSRPRARGRSKKHTPSSVLTEQTNEKKSHGTGYYDIKDRKCHPGWGPKTFSKSNHPFQIMVYTWILIIIIVNSTFYACPPF